MAKQPKSKVDCPKCGRSQPLQGDDTVYWCANCQGMFDADRDGDGGDYSDRDPSARLQREERNRENAIRARRGPR